MIAPDAALGIILEHVRPLKPVRVPLAEALGCFLAEDVRADRDLPPADRSSRDGYALRHEDIGRPLIVIAEVVAGSPARPRVAPGTCVRILTGANVPVGADTVAMQEDTEESNGMATVRSAEARGANILRRGEDAAKGTILLARGTRMGAAEVGVCAAVGKAFVKVHARPRVTVLCTGSELRGISDPVRPHEIRNSNGPALCAALQQWGYPGARYIQVADRRSALVAALRRAVKRHDVVLFTGGVSVGSYDYVREAVEEAGAKVRFHGVSMKPGKPTLYATLPSGRHVFGLPGNPLSSLTAFHEFALPALRKLAGRPAEACRPAWPLPLAEAIAAESRKLRCVLARLVADPGGLSAAPVHSASSADLVAAARADGVVLLPPDRAHYPAGEVVMFRPWRPLA